MPPPAYAPVFPEFVPPIVPPVMVSKPDPLPMYTPPPYTLVAAEGDVSSLFDEMVALSLTVRFPFTIYTPPPYASSEPLTMLEETSVVPVSTAFPVELSYKYKPPPP